VSIEERDPSGPARSAESGEAGVSIEERD
jgi:hypothetical protein